MKVLVQRFNNRPKVAKLLEWGRLVTIIGSAQIAVQALGFAGGILVIRLLPTQEYALYTLANTMVGTMVLLADGGISAGVMSQGGKVWQSRELLGSVLVTGLDLRRKFAILSLLVATPVLLYLLRHHHASWPMSILLTASLIPVFFTTLSGTLLEIAPKLHQSILPMQRIQVGSSIGRLALLGVSLFVFPWAYVAVLAAGIPQIWANRRLRGLARLFADDTRPVDNAVRREILSKVKRLLPDVIYYCFSCQFTMLIISFFGSTAAVAQMGALGRLGMALNVFVSLFTALILPRFARLPDQAKLLFNHYIRLVAGLLVLSVGIVGGTWLFSTQILWVLGRQYAHLDTEIILMMIGQCLSFVAASTFLLCTSKGWVINPLFSIPLSLTSVAGGILFINVSTLRGIFTLDIVVAVVLVLMHFTYGMLQITKINTTRLVASS